MGFPTLALSWVQEGWSFSRPFNVGGIGTMQFHRPFDVVGVPYSAAFHRPFHVIGRLHVQFNRPFDVVGDLQWRYHRPFNVVAAIKSPSIGGNIGTAGIYLTAPAPAGATSVTLSSVTGLGIGTTIRIGTATEYRELTGLAANVASFTAPLVASYPVGTPVIGSTSTLTSPASAGATTVEVADATGLAPGAVIQIGTDVRTVTGVTGTTVSLSYGLTAAAGSGAAFYLLAPSPTTNPDPLTSAFVGGLLIFDKGGAYLGNLPQRAFTIDDAPSRVVLDNGGMRFHMPRARNRVPNPYLDLLFDDRLVLVADSIGSPPWLGSMTVEDWEGGQVVVTVQDATSLLGGPHIEIKDPSTEETSAAAVYQKVVDLMNEKRTADGELIWDTDIDTTEIFHGELKLEGDPGSVLATVARRSLTEYTWVARYEGGRARVTLVVRDQFSAPGFTLHDGPGANIAAGPRLIIDPSPIVHTIRVRGRPVDLTSKSAECSTSGAINCLDWMDEAEGISTKLIPEAIVSVDPGPRRRREDMKVELDWGLSQAEEEAAAAEVTARAIAMYHSFLRAWHDQYGRPFWSKDGWQYKGPPSELERFLNTHLHWRTRLQLVEYRGQPASIVMTSDTQKQALLVQYSLQLDEQTVRRVWHTEAGGMVNVTRMSVSGSTRIYTVIGGVITDIRWTTFVTSSALVGAPTLYMYPGDGERPTTYKTLRRVISISEDGAVTEAMYFDSDAPLATAAVPNPYKFFAPAQLPDGILNDDFIGKVYDFESRAICDWDPRRDGVGVTATRPTVLVNQLTSTPRWHFAPWGDGTGSTVITMGISATDTVIYVENAFVLPTATPYTATIDDGLSAEDVLVTGIEGTRLTITRAQNGTEAIIHPAGTAFVRKTDCDQEPTDPDDLAEKVPFPAGEAYGLRLLERLSKPVRRLVVQLINVDGEWSSVQAGALLTVNIASEGPAGGITGTWRVLGWAPAYHEGAMELLTEEVL